MLQRKHRRVSLCFRFRSLKSTGKKNRLPTDADFALKKAPEHFKVERPRDDFIDCLTSIQQTVTSSTYA